MSNSEPKKPLRKPVSLRYKVPNDPYQLVNKIVDHYPRHYDKYTLRKLMSIGKIIYSTAESMTACVINTKPYTLCFGVPFMEDYMETIEDCVYMLSHELTHLALDHFATDIQNLFKDKSLGKKAAHIIVDCQVNATCHHSLVEGKYFEFVNRFYKQDQMPECFFRADGTPPSEYKDAHEKLYSKEGITNEDLIDALMPWFEENQDKLDEIKKKLLGNHDDMFKDRAAQDGDLSEIAEHVVDQLEDFLDKGDSPSEESTESEENDPEGRGKGDVDKDLEEINQGGDQGGSGGTPNEQFIRTVRAKQNYARRIRQQIDDVWERSPQAKIHKAIEDLSPKRRSRGVIPNFRDRRAAAIYASGKWPIFFKNRRIGDKVMVPCYLDVSGSQSHVLPVMLPVVARLKELVGDEVFCFSTKVSPCKVSDLEAGNYYSGGGTDFDPVAKHILENQYRCALILTDGQAGLNEELIKQLRQRGINIKVGWTIPNPDLQPLKQVCNEMFYVFDEGTGSD